MKTNALTCSAILFALSACGATRPADSSGAGGSNEGTGGGGEAIGGAAESNATGGAAAGGSASGGAVVSGQAGTAGTAGTPASSSGGSPASSDPPDTSRWSFEAGTQGWKDYGPNLKPNNDPSKVGVRLQDPVQVTTNAYAGKGALEYHIGKTGATGHGDEHNHFLAVGGLFSATRNLRVVFHVMIPAGNSLKGVQPFVLGECTQFSDNVPHGSLDEGQWLDITLHVSPTCDGKDIFLAGLQFIDISDWDGEVYVDSVDWLAN